MQVNRLKLCAVAVMLCALTLAGCKNAQTRKEEHITRGANYLRDEQYQEALLEYRNALQLDPSSARATWGLIQALEGAGRYPEAFNTLKEFARNTPDHLEARVKIGNYYLAPEKPQQELIDEAERQAQEILKRDPNYIEGHILMATVRLAQNKPGEAKAELEKAVALDPQRAESHLSLARFYVKTKDNAQAEAAYQRALGVGDKFALAHLEYGKFLAQTGRGAQAEGEFRRATEVEPQNRNAWTTLASYYLSQRQNDRAEQAFQKLAELQSSRPDGRAPLADFYAATGRNDQALKLYQETVAQFPEHARARYRLGELLLARNDAAGAGAQADEILKRGDKDNYGLLLRGRARMQQGDAKNAVIDLGEALKQDPTSRESLYYMAQAQYRAGQMEQARVFAGELERNHPGFLPAKLVQAQITLATGDAKKALDLTNEVLARLDAPAYSSETTTQSVGDLRARALTMRALAHLLQNDLAGARADFSAVRDAVPNDPESYNNLAAVAFREKNLSEAQSLYDKALSLDAANFDALNGVVNLAAANGTLDAAHARLDAAIRQFPQNAALHYLKANAYGFQQNAQGAENELRQALQLDPNYLAAYTQLAALYFRTNQVDRALAEYRQVLERRSDDAATYTLMGMMEDSRGNYDAAAENYRKALAVNENLPIAANNLSWLYAEHGKGNLDEALRYMQTVVQRNPNVAGYLDTLGWVYHKKGLNAQAIDQFKKVVAGAGDVPVYRYHLGVAYAGIGKKDDARRELQAALQLGEKSEFQQADAARQALSSL